MCGGGPIIWGPGVSSFIPENQFKVSLPAEYELISKLFYLMASNQHRHYRCSIVALGSAHSRNYNCLPDRMSRFPY